MKSKIREKIKKDKECKGLFWRGRVGAFRSFDKSGELSNDYGVRKSLRFLKSISCPGCEKCSCSFDNIREYFENCIDPNEDFLSGIKHGGLYTFKIEFSGYSYEYPEEVDMEVFLIEVNEK